jgi:putative transposase
MLEGSDEILTVTQLELPKKLRRALAYTNIIDNVMSTVRRVCRKCGAMALGLKIGMRWTAAPGPKLRLHAT